MVESAKTGDVGGSGGSSGGVAIIAVTVGNSRIKFASFANLEMLDSGAVTINTQSGTSIGLAGSYTNNDIVANTKSYVNNSTVDATGDVKIEATNESEITSINASGSGASAAGRDLGGVTGDREKDIVQGGPAETDVIDSDSGLVEIAKHLNQRLRAT